MTVFGRENSIGKAITVCEIVRRHCPMTMNVNIEWDKEKRAMIEILLRPLVTDPGPMQKSFRNPLNKQF